MPKKEKSPRAETRVDGRRNEHPRRDKRAVEDSPPVTSPSIPRLRASAVSSFSVTSWLYQLADGESPFVPSPFLVPSLGEDLAARRTRKQVGDLAEAEKEKRPAYVAHRALWYRHRGLPFTLYLFYFIFRGINVFGALPVG